MKKHFLLPIILILVNSLVLAQDGGDYCSEGKIRSFERLSKLSAIQYPGDSNIDVTYYKLDLRVTVNPNNLSGVVAGVVTVRAKSTNNNLNSFYLDLVNALAVSSVKLNGNNLSFS